MPRLPLRAAAELCAAALLLAGLASLIPASWRPAAPPASTEARSSPYAVDLATVRADPRFADVLWLDARRPADFAAAHIPGALRLTEGEWEDLLPAVLDQWSPGRAIVVYCDSPACGASEHIAGRLRRELGDEAVFALAGGWPAWSESAPAP